ncbi:MAG: glycosyltransferase family 4 protein [Nitrospirae bacterium]|nr:glycosyltransferase family 4 protein [Nitrospirota bacterium]
MANMKLKTAVVHDWLVTYAGSERVLEQILKLCPGSDLFSLIDFIPKNERGFLLDKHVETSFIQKFPFAKKRYRDYLPFMPFAIGRFNLSGYELIISSSHSVAKGVKKRPGQIHICYCHTPMRYAWDLKEQYLRESGLDRGIKGYLADRILSRIRGWDYSTASGVDHFIANSNYIKDRIKRAYGRDAHVIYPPVDTGSFRLEEKKEDFYLAVSRMVPYKKMDIIAEAFSDNGLPLVIIGDGPDYEKVRAKAKGKKNIALLGFQAGEVMKEYMRKAKAFVFAAEEDFGIVPVEAQACGTPVIAYGKGGALETVISPDEAEGPTGVFFNEQNSRSLNEAVERFESNRDKFDPHKIRANAERFGIERFRKEFRDFVNGVLAGK